MRATTLVRVLVSCLPIALAAAPAVAAFHCDSTTGLTLVGVDTTAARAVFGLPRSGGEPSWLIEADFAAGSAHAWPESVARFGGSSGPGPVVAATRCGAGCLQVLQFRAGGGWERLGEPLLASEASTLYLTWDRQGSPWAILHAAGTKGGAVAKAYRLERGDWVSKGAASVRGAGSAGAAPAPVGEEGVTSGDVAFTASSAPRRWLSSLPAGVGASNGEPLWLGGTNAVYAAADGFRTSSDAGVTWQSVRWQALSEGEGDLAWRAGRDYQVELPEGERVNPLAAIWVDRRVADQAKLQLAAQGDGGWHVLLRAQDGILTATGERLSYDHVLRFAGERWALVTGCVARGGRATLAVRRFSDGKLDNPQLIPVELPAAP